MEITAVFLLHFCLDVHIMLEKGGVECYDAE